LPESLDAVGSAARPLPKRASVRAAVFLDRDSTVIEDMEFSVDPARIRALPGAVEGMRRLQEAGYPLVLITNQSGVARGLFTEEGLRAFHDRLRAWLAERGVRIEAVYHCPHYPNGKVPEYTRKCACRKPEPGMILAAARDLGLDLTRSWMIGDRDCDTGAGRNAGCRTILVKTAIAPVELTPRPDFIAEGIAEAAEIILSQGGPDRA